MLAAVLGLPWADFLRARPAQEQGGGLEVAGGGQAGSPLGQPAVVLQLHPRPHLLLVEPIDDQVRQGLGPQGGGNYEKDSCVAAKFRNLRLKVFILKSH